MTDFKLSNWAKLDRRLALKEIEAAHGSPIFDKYSILSPNLTARQISDALGVSFGPFDRLSPSRSDAIIETALSGGGGGGGYVAKAVHFDGSAYLDIVSLAATDNQFFSSVMWINLDTGLDPNMFPGLFQVDAAGSYTVGGGTFTDGDPDHLNKYYWASRMADVLGGQLMSVDNETVPTGPLNAGDWYCFIASYDTLNGIAKVCINDAVPSDIEISVSALGIMAFNGKQFTVGGDTFEGDNWVGSLADVRLMPGINLLDGGGDIPLATRRLFIDGGGKPVDPAIATAELGAPAILFSGDAGTFGTNQGAGGAFTLTGALTNATTSPSD